MINTYYTMDELKTLANQFLNKEIKRKNITFYTTTDAKVFDMLVRLKKLQIKKVINRTIARALFFQYCEDLNNKNNNIDILDFTKHTAIKVNKREGEINTRIVGSKDKRVKLWS